MIIKKLPNWRDREVGEFQYGLTEISTLRMTALLWETMSHEGETAWKPQTVYDLFKKPFVNNCPCCEFAFDPEYDTPDCQKCPMRDWWGETYLYDQDAWEATPLANRIYHCESMMESPYRIWMESDSFDMWILAEEVSNLAKEALDWWLALKEMNE